MLLHLGLRDSKTQFQAVSLGPIRFWCDDWAMLCGQQWASGKILSRRKSADSTAPISMSVLTASPNRCSATSAGSTDELEDTPAIWDKLVKTTAALPGWRHLPHAWRFGDGAEKSNGQGEQFGIYRLGFVTLAFVQLGRWLLRPAWSACTSFSWFAIGRRRWGKTRLW